MLIDQLDIPSTFSELRLSFRGPEASPFLAPRGIWLHDDKLFVSDTGRNRVFIWNELPKSEYQSPDIILGQTGTSGTQRNGEAGVTASSLQYPSGIWSDGKRLILADAWNHRVLIWHEFPRDFGAPADTVLGQRDFLANEPNADGVGANCSASTLYWPYGVHSDGQQLWVADTGNRRVLHWSEIPQDHFAPAEGVIGQPNFESRDYDPDNAIWPYSVRVDSKGRMAITDTQFFRVLLWASWQEARSGKAPDQLFGQHDLMSNGQNQFGLTASEQSLNWCYDSFFKDDSLYIVDTANSRIKRHHVLFSGNSPTAEGLLGQPDYTTGSENVANLKGTETALYWPFAMAIQDNLLAIADTGNHRILINHLTT